MDQHNHYLPLFDLPSFPYGPTSHLTRLIVASRTRHPSHNLIFDLLTALAHIRSPPATLGPLYPPTDVNGFRHLLGEIHVCGFDELKKECLVYYLMRDWDAAKGEARAGVWARERRMPMGYRQVTDAYWLLDHGEAAAAVAHLTDPRLTPDFTSHILHALTPAVLRTPPNPITDDAVSAQLVLRFLRHCRPRLSEYADLEVQLVALCEASFGDAWAFVLSFADADEAGKEDSWGEGSVQRGPIHTRLVKRLIEWCLIPKPRQNPLLTLLSLPLPPSTLALLKSLALHPPASFPLPNLPILHTLLHTRLLQLGHYSAAVALEAELSQVLQRRGFADRLGEQGARIAGEAQRGRREAMAVVAGILPKVQSKLLRAAEEAAEPAPTMNGDVDMDAASGEPEVEAEAKMDADVPLSSSIALRTARPHTAVLQAFALSNASTSKRTPATTPNKVVPRNVAVNMNMSMSSSSSARSPFMRTTPRPTGVLVSSASPQLQQQQPLPRHNTAVFGPADGGQPQQPMMRNNAMGAWMAPNAAAAQQEQQMFALAKRKRDIQLRRPSVGDGDVEMEGPTEVVRELEAPAAPSEKPKSKGKGKGKEKETEAGKEKGKEKGRGREQVWDRERSLGVDMDESSSDDRPRKRKSPDPRGRSVQPVIMNSLDEQAQAIRDPPPEPEPTPRKTPRRRGTAKEPRPPLPLPSISADVTIPGAFPTGPAKPMSQSSEASADAESTGGETERGDSLAPMTPRTTTTTMTRRRTRAHPDVEEDEPAVPAVPKARRTTRGSTPHRQDAAEVVPAARMVRRSTRLSEIAGTGNGPAEGTPSRARTPAKGKGKGKAPAPATTTPARRLRGFGLQSEE